MFAGIIQHVGVVRSLRTGHAAGGGPARLEIDLGPLAAGVQPGASVAVNGACLTVVCLRDTVAAFDVVPETLRATSLGTLHAGDVVNLERSLRVGDPIDGHFVQGHVDGRGTVERLERSAAGVMLWIRVPRSLGRFIVRKGAIAVDGVSLTVVDVQPQRFSVALIPTTLSRTTLGRRRPGDTVNIETDILARILVARMDRETAAAEDSAGLPAPVLNRQTLQAYGYAP